MATPEEDCDFQFTYSGNPATSDLDAVRFYTGDTAEAKASFDDREINFVLVGQPNVLLASADMLQALANKVACDPESFKVGEVAKTLGDKANKLLRQAKELRKRAYESAAPFFGGVSRAENDRLDEITDSIPPSATRRQFDNIRATQFDGEDSGEI